MEHTYQIYFDKDASFNWKLDEYYNRIFLEAQISWAKVKFQTNGGYLFLNDVLDAMGMRRTTMGQTHGWSKFDNAVNIEITPDINAAFLVTFNELTSIVSHVDAIEGEK